MACPIRVALGRARLAHEVECLRLAAKVLERAEALQRLVEGRLACSLSPAARAAQARLLSA